MGGRVFTPEQIDFLKANVPGRTFTAITKLFNSHFELQLSCEQIKSAAKSRGIYSSLPCRFEAGHIPYNKGQIGRPRRTPNSSRIPLGAERMKRGTLEVKVAFPRTWRGKHLLIWEALHGPVPEGHAVVFGDGDKSNLDPDNLVLLARNEMMCMRMRGLIGGSAELTQTGKAVADVYLAIYDRRKRERNGTHQNQPT